MARAVGWSEPKKHTRRKALQALATATGWPYATLDQWKRKGWITTDARGAWDSRAIWKVAKERMREGGAGGASSRDERDERVEKLRLENERLRLKIAAEKGELVFRDSVEEAIAAMRNFVRDRLGAVAESMPPDVREEVRGQLRNICAELQTKADGLWLQSPKQ